MIRCIDIIKIFQDPRTEYKVAALRGLDLDIKEGELVSVIGPSGAGKTTLIKILAGIELPTSGQIIMNGQRFDQLDEYMRREFRFYHLGLINQFISDNLFSHLSVRQNLMIPKKMFYLPREQAKKDVEEIAKLLNLRHVYNNTVGKLSGGEAMRLSMGVALAKDPLILLADEPTGQLDTKNTQDIIDAIKQVNLALGKTIVVVTHDIRFRTIFEKSFIIRDGRLAGISRDMERDELEFLMHSSDMNRSYMDASNYVRVPDEVKSTTAIKDIVEFDSHPSRKLGLFWNPEVISRDKIYEIISKPAKESEDKVDQISFKDVEHLLSRAFIPPDKKKKLITVKNVTKGYHSQAGYNEVIKNMSLNIHEGDFVFISGPSGVGKTTLLNMIAGLIKPNDGLVTVMKYPISEEDEREVSAFRLANIAYVTQHNNLFDPIKVHENFLIPSIFSDINFDVEYSDSIVKECHIGHRLEAYPYELSEGEKQRAALASALSRKTKIILTDEPTANLDAELARHIIDLLMDIVRINKATIVTCSHDLTLLRPGFRHLEMLDGKINKDYRITKENLENTIREYLLIKEDNK
ncbi:MAG: ATP-binding cassette domain-containing protein [Candidatus Heimdallarchaeota archaeon]|jgi:putative ABC transport system ATP-binding protein|nr:ATP-binding cassette domain-containing protein [Candidatus Heimdallarchaeota archaeon]MCK4253826.1 ATP-binding cassette domain-containing protein [Candidatus Heimdallarchaeota archaeon]